MGGTCRSEGKNNKFMVRCTGKSYANGTEVSDSGKKGNIKSSNTSKYQENKAVIPHEASFC
jgi:hypothetical protein